ncbi:Hypothetical protein A7982_09307 [Minicystis rosea]|nr:Hypothetical protein A7982_09307 [Minicystis rosea]
MPPALVAKDPKNQAHRHDTAPSATLPGAPHEASTPSATPLSHGTRCGLGPSPSVLGSVLTQVGRRIWQGALIGPAIAP